jgi:hypothetical protein
MLCKNKSTCFLVQGVLLEDLLECVQNGVEADAFFQGSIGFFLEPLKQGSFVCMVESVYDFISETDVTVDGINWLPQRLAQEPNAQGK